jgi:hypothetical protein
MVKNSKLKVSTDFIGDLAAFQKQMLPVFICKSCVMIFLKCELQQAFYLN